jgi:hypothetical protein
LFCSQSCWVPAGSSYSCSSSYLVDVCPCLDFGAVSTLFSAWLSGEGISIVVFWALTVLGSEVVLLQMLNPACGLSFAVLKTHEPGYCRVVSVQVELLSIEVLMEMLQCPHNCK